MTTDKEPQPPEYISAGHSSYNGRDFYGTGVGCNGHADERAELTYLRDWKAWAEKKLKGYASWERSVNEALNTGDGSYKP